MARRRKQAMPRPTQFGVIEAWKGQTLVRIFRREDGGARLIAAIAGTPDIVAHAVDIGIDQQLDQHAIAAGVQRRGKSEGFQTKWLSRSEVGRG